MRIWMSQNCSFQTILSTLYDDVKLAIKGSEVTTAIFADYSRASIL